MRWEVRVGQQHPQDTKRDLVTCQNSAHMALIPHQKVMQLGILCDTDGCLGVILPHHHKIEYAKHLSGLDRTRKLPSGNVDLQGQYPITILLQGIDSRCYRFIFLCTYSKTNLPISSHILCYHMHNQIFVICTLQSAMQPDHHYCKAYNRICLGQLTKVICMSKFTKQFITFCIRLFTKYITSMQLCKYMCTYIISTLLCSLLINNLFFILSSHAVWKQLPIHTYT